MNCKPVVCNAELPGCVGVVRVCTYGHSRVMTVPLTDDTVVGTELMYSSILPEETVVLLSEVSYPTDSGAPNGVASLRTHPPPTVLCMESLPPGWKRRYLLASPFTSALGRKLFTLLLPVNSPKGLLSACVLHPGVRGSNETP